MDVVPMREVQPPSNEVVVVVQKVVYQCDGGRLVG
jgi:hypothetical protein